VICVTNFDKLFSILFSCANYLNSALVIQATIVIGRHDKNNFGCGIFLYSVKPKATCHITRQSKYQCTRLGSVSNLNSQASSPIAKGESFHIKFENAFKFMRSRLLFSNWYFSYL